MKHNNEKFKDLYQPVQKKVHIIKEAFSWLSGGTLGIAAGLITYSHINELNTLLAVIISASVGVVIGFLIESMIRVLTPVFFKQVFQWEFHDWRFRLMFSMVLILLLGGYFISGTFSFHASKDMVSIVSPTPDGKDIESVQDGFSTIRADISTQYTKQEAGINKSSDSQIKAIKTQYNDKITEKRRQAKQLKASGKAGHNWLISSVIPNLQNTMNRKITDVNNKRSEQIANLNKSRQLELSKISDQSSLVIGAAVADNKALKRMHLTKTQMRGLGLGLLTVMCIAGFFMLTGWNELYKSGVNQPPAPGPVLIPISSTENRPREIEKLKLKPESLNSSTLSVPVEGFTGTFNIQECRDKIKSYEWKLDKGVGRIATNNTNIAKFEEAIMQIKKQSA